MKTVVLENEILRVELLPEMGGKIISFFRKDRGFELAAGAHRKEHVKPEPEEGFAPYAYGMDEAFPNIDAEKINWMGRELSYPDHGEIWSHEFQIVRQEPLEAELSMQSEIFDYRYEKQLFLEEESLRIVYRITNTGKEELPCIWTWHGLMRYEEDMEILLPEEIGHCRNVLGGSPLGEVGKIYEVDKSPYNFRRVPKASSCSMVKYYGEERVEKGCCGFRYPAQKISCLMSYDAKALPWFGVWITAGGFQGDYNCALEPSSGFYDGIGNAQRMGRLPILKAGEKMEFEISIALLSLHNGM